MSDQGHDPAWCTCAISPHDLHIWALSSDSPSLSAHLVLAEGSDDDPVRRAAADVLDQRFHITHVTLQTEAHDCREEREKHGLH